MIYGEKVKEQGKRNIKRERKVVRREGKEIQCNYMYRESKYTDGIEGSEICRKKEMITIRFGSTYTKKINIYIYIYIYRMVYIMKVKIQREREKEREVKRRREQKGRGQCEVRER